MQKQFLYKWNGFSIAYNKTNTINYHGKENHSWWGDILKNKDESLIAVQN